MRDIFLCETFPSFIMFQMQCERVNFIIEDETDYVKQIRSYNFLAE